MMKIQWNDGWFFSKLGDGHSTQITLPHDAMILENRSPDSLGGKNTGWYEGNDYVYTKNFFAPSEYEEKLVIIEFEGVYHNAEVYLNEEKIAFRPYGYTNFYVDISKKMKINEKNELKVIARNADQPNSRWYSGAGIYRPVQLYVLPEKHIVLNGIKIRTLSYQTQTIEVTVETNSSGIIDIEFLGEENILASKSLKTDGKEVWILELPDAKLWNTDTPHLYKCRVKFGEQIGRAHV